MSAGVREQEPPSPDLDQRFSQLLKPIKDLTQNWEVSPVQSNISLLSISLVIARFLCPSCSQTTLRNCSKSSSLWMEARPPSTLPRQRCGCRVQRLSTARRWSSSTSRPTRWWSCWPPRLTTTRRFKWRGRQESLEVSGGESTHQRISRIST